MKSIRSILAGVSGFFAALFLTSCSTNPEMPKAASVTESFTVLMVTNTETKSLLIGGKADGSGEATVVSAGELPITGPDGNAFDFSDLQPGHILNLTWDGLIAESYPAQIHHVEAISVTGKQPEGWVNPIDSDPFFDSWRNAAASNPFYSGIPTLQVSFRTESESSGIAGAVNAAQGTASWYENGEGICVDSPHPLDWEADRIPVIPHSGVKELTLSFSREPDSVSVHRWDWSQHGVLSAAEDWETAELSGSILPLPPQGEYLYEITAEWAEGSAAFVFALR